MTETNLGTTTPHDNRTVLPEHNFELAEAVTFLKFPELPKEIQLKIWQQAVLGLPGRIIPLLRTIFGFNPGVPPILPRHISSKQPHPSLALVSSQARLVVLETLDRVAAMPSKFPGGFVSTNFDKDTLFLPYNPPDSDLFEGFFEDMADNSNKIKHLAQEDSALQSCHDIVHSFYGWEMLQLFKWFPAVETMTVVIPISDHGPRGKTGSREFAFVDIPEQLLNNYSFQVHIDAMRWNWALRWREYMRANPTCGRTRPILQFKHLVIKDESGRGKEEGYVTLEDSNDSKSYEYLLNEAPGTCQCL